MASHNAKLPFRTAAVLGAGVMGAQIAAHLANAGLLVHLPGCVPFVVSALCPFVWSSMRLLLNRIFHASRRVSKRRRWPRLRAQGYARCRCPC